MAKLTAARAAFNAGKTRYFTGKACRNGHIAERMVSNRQCVICLNSKRERRRKSPAEKLDRIRRSERMRNDPVMRAHVNELQRANHARRLVRRIAAHVEMMGRPVAHRCEICLCEPTEGNRIVFDHCHSSGMARGWLCDRCNKVLGLARDDATILQRMIQYLEKANGGINGKSQEGTSEFFLRWTEPQLSGAK
jgi:hypothetical protein